MRFILMLILAMLLAVHTSMAYTYTYQENANSTSHNGECDNPTNAYDGDWNTYAIDHVTVPSSGNRCNIFMNYSVPTGSVSAIWQIKDYAGIRNLTIPSECFNNSTIQVYASLLDQISYDEIIWYCINNTGISKYLTWLQFQPETFYEDGIFWSSINDVVLLLNGSNQSLTGTYPYAVNFSCQSNASMSTYLNGSIISNDAVHDLSAGFWVFACNNSDGKDGHLNLTINKANPGLILTSNTSSSITVAEHCSVACSESHGLAYDFLMDGSAESSPKVLAPPSVGVYNFTCEYVGDENYTSSLSYLLLSVTAVPLTESEGINAFLGAFAAIGIGFIIFKSYYGGKKR